MGLGSIEGVEIKYTDHEEEINMNQKEYGMGLHSVNGDWKTYGASERRWVMVEPNEIKEK